jgi:hypothetical protein
MHCRLVWRIVLLSCGSLLAACVICGVALQIRQYMLRHRAERLLADMQSIKLRRTTFEEVQPIIRRWQHWGHYEGPCDRSQCTFDIVLADANTFPNPFLYSHLWFFDLASRFGWRPAWIRARLIVLDGVVWMEMIGFETEIHGRGQDEREYLEPVSGVAMSVSKIELLRSVGHWRLHPEYSISSPDNLPNVVRLEFTPFADSTEVRRLMFLNFECLTRHAPCRKRDEIMPAAVGQEAYWSSLPDNPDSGKPLCENPDALVVELESRDAKNVVIVKVDAKRRAPGPGTMFEESLVLDQILKARVPEKLRAAKDPWMFASPGPGGAFPAGTSVILFLKNDSFNGYSLEDCSPLSVTANHLLAVRRGIEEDNRPASLPEFASQPVGTP